MAPAGDTPDHPAALLRRQPGLQRRADQLIPVKRHLLRPLPAFHRVLIEAAHHSADPYFVVERTRPTGVAEQ
jgi:hypothetical protein